MTTLTQDQHDRAVRFIAANRYPFPDQPHPSWPLHYRTWVNTATHPRRSIETPDGPHFPDIMIVDGENATREIGEVEMDFGPEIATRWKAASEAADDTTETGARHLLVYVPEGREDEALAILEGNDISFHALRGVRVDDDGSVHVLPHRTIPPFVQVTSQEHLGGHSRRPVTGARSVDREVDARRAPEV